MLNILTISLFSDSLLVRDKRKMWFIYIYEIQKESNENVNFKG